MRPPSLVARFLADRSGSIIVLAVLGMPLFVGALGLGAETGYWYMSQRQLQHAADLAAHAGAVGLQAGATKARVQATSIDVAMGNGAKTGDALRINAPPLAGPLAGDPLAVEVVISRAHAPLFSGLFRSDPVNANGRAVSKVDWSSKKQACILALNVTAPGAITASGSTAVTLNGCDLVSNSNAADSFLSGSAPVRARCLYTVGGAVGSPSLECGSPVTNTTPARDPFAAVAEPVVTGTCDKAVFTPGGTTTLTPAVLHPSGVPFMRFCNGLDVKGNLVMNPGLYIIEGKFTILGGADQSTTDVSISGSGVTLYFTSGSSIALNGRTTAKLSAPSSGPFQGILMFGSRASALLDQKLAASPMTSMQGAIYMTKARVEFAGNATISGCVQVIADQVLFTGSSQMVASCPEAQAIRTAERVVIVE